MMSIKMLRALVLNLLFPQTIITWTDYHAVNVLAYTRKKGNGSMDQGVVVLVNDAIFAYFDQKKQTFILRPSSSAGFSVLEKRSGTFCLTEVFKGFLRQAKYLEKFQDDAQSSEPLLARPSVEVYTEFPEEQGKVNTLYCYATGFYPGDIEMDLFVNGVNVKGETSDLMYGQDWTYRIYKHVTIAPEPGDKYKCEVKHSSIPEPKVTVWVPEFSESHLYWVYTLFLSILLGITVCVYILRRQRPFQP
ncbi:class II histocompatibility antigen, B-L beta chain [Triplophysa dalaica]|uniref:class II histocompatibility antigen, B-L beta chain n=1 Tax=Triplophysa dalaica TaxID=1582913 RepID=UPI0024DF7DCD|nr:class II histocompatibility antigen, B-L beta chain [Triplophysa dalaica]